MIVRAAAGARTVLGLLAGAGARRGRRAHAGPHPQPARRPRPARRQRRRVVRGGRSPSPLLGVSTPSGYVWFAFAGAARRQRSLVYAIGSAGRGGATPVTLALAGAARQRPAVALVRAVLRRRRAALDALPVLGGRLARRPRTPTSPGRWCRSSSPGLVLALVNAPALNLLALGEDVARGLGQRIWLARGRRAGRGHAAVRRGHRRLRPDRLRRLVVPHVVRAVTGPDHRWLLPCSGLVGASLLLVADVARPGRRPARGAAGRHRARADRRARSSSPWSAARRSGGRCDRVIRAVRPARVSGRRGCAARHRGRRRSRACCSSLVLVSGAEPRPRRLPDRRRRGPARRWSASARAPQRLRRPGAARCRGVVGAAGRPGARRRRRALPDLRPQPAGQARHPRHHRRVPRSAPSQRSCWRGRRVGGALGALGIPLAALLGAARHRGPAVRCSPGGPGSTATGWCWSASALSVVRHGAGRLAAHRAEIHDAAAA